MPSGRRALPESFEQWQAIPDQHGESDSSEVGEEVGPVVPTAEVVGELGDEFGKKGQDERQSPLRIAAGDEQNDQGQPGEKDQVGRAELLVDFAERPVEITGVTGNDGRRWFRRFGGRRN